MSGAVEVLRPGTYKDLCSTCGIDKKKTRDMVFLSKDISCWIKDRESRCPECGHWANGSTLLSLRDWKYTLIKNAEERGYQKGKKEACLALESLDRLEKWLNKKYAENWFVLTNNKDLEEARIIRNFIKEVLGVIQNE